MNNHSAMVKSVCAEIYHKRVKGKQNFERKYNIESQSTLKILFKHSCYY